MLATQEMLEKYRILSERNRNHPVGTELYFYDQYCKGYRPGVVTHVIKHYAAVYYVLDVPVGPPINDSYLDMKSAFVVRTRDQLEDDEIYKGGK
ncbi:hypothetical protein Roomu2_00120 [Pseudomonas phage vB_PpuM-Roomu-2]|uniref:Uncharacterized protein n=2 Tax=Tartuvirus TaxID=3424912 RepID=A0AAX4MZY3_9CAUD